MPLYYQWYYEHDIIPGMLNHIVYMPVISYYICIGENKSFYCIVPATIRSAGRYYCQVENQYGVVNSTIATVAVTTVLTVRSPLVDSRFTYSPNLASNKEFSIPEVQEYTSSKDLTS